MTLDELADTLPNGFHDAEVASLRIDYVRREAVIELEIWIGDLSSSDLDRRELYRLATLTLSGLNYFCIEPPVRSSPNREGGPIMVDTGTVESLKEPPESRLPDATPGDGFTNWFFVSDWSAFMYVSAQSASLAWHDERETG